MIFLMSPPSKYPFSFLGFFSGNCIFQGMLIKSDKTCYGCDDIKLLYNSTEETYVKCFSPGKVGYLITKILVFGLLKCLIAYSQELWPPGCYTSWERLRFDNRTLLALISSGIC